MQFSAALILSAAGLVAAGSYGGDYNKNVTYTTEVVTEYTTYCPEPTVMTYGDKTYTVTEPTTITITDCPKYGGCTITKPVYSTSKVYCHGCGHNATATAAGTGDYKPKPTQPPVVEAGAAKAAGAGLAALVGLVAFAL